MWRDIAIEIIIFTPSKDRGANGMCSVQFSDMHEERTSTTHKKKWEGGRYGAIGDRCKGTG